MILFYTNSTERDTSTFKELTSFTYNGARNPATISPGEARKEPHKGANCESSAWAWLEELYSLKAANLRALELYYDRTHTRPIKDISQIQTGDLIGLCSENQGDLSKIHIGIALVEGEIVNIRHTAKHIGRTAVQPLEEVRKHAGHAVLAWIRRPILNNSL